MVDHTYEQPGKATTTPEAKLFGAYGWNRRMRIARERAELSVENVAKALGVTPSAVRNWEGAHKFPSREPTEFAKLTAVDMVWVITGFNTDELKLAGKLVGQARAVPVFQPNQLTERNPQQWDDAPTVFASFPCSDEAFATEVFDHRNSPEYEPGDIVILDPVVTPAHDDWVLASVGPARSIIFARYVLPGLDLQVEEHIERICALAKEKSSGGGLAGRGSRPGRDAAVHPGAAGEEQDRRASRSPDRMAGTLARAANSVPRHDRSGVGHDGRAPIPTPYVIPSRLQRKSENSLTGDCFHFHMVT